MRLKKTAAARFRFAVLPFFALLYGPVFAAEKADSPGDPASAAISALKPFDVLAKTPFDIATLELIAEIETPSMRQPFNDLKAMVNRSFNSVPQVLRSIENRRAAEAGREEAFAGYLPRVSATVGKGRTNYSRYPDSTSRDSSLTASQLLYDFGATGGAVDAADARAKAAGHEESRDRSLTLVNMLRAVFDLERARRNLFFSRGYVSSRELFLGVTMEREKIGGGSKLDVVRARTKVSEASDEIPGALKDVAAAESRFRELFGAPPPTQKLSFRLPATEVRVDVDTSAIVRQLPAFMNADAAVVAALGDYEASKGRMWGGLNFEVSNSQSDVGSAAESKQTTAQVVYRVDVFSGFAQSARATAAAARYSQAQSERDRVYRELIANAEVSTQSYKAALASRVNRVSLVAGARETDGSTRELFLMGKAPLSDVFRAQEEFFSAVQKLIRAQFDYEVAMVEYLASRGELLPLFDLGT